MPLDHKAIPAPQPDEAISSPRRETGERMTITMGDEWRYGDHNESALGQQEWGPTQGEKPLMPPPIGEERY